MARAKIAFGVILISLGIILLFFILIPFGILLIIIGIILIIFRKGEEFIEERQDIDLNKRKH
jgi:hypothetical protein